MNASYVMSLRHSSRSDLRTQIKHPALRYRPRGLSASPRRSRCCVRFNDHVHRLHPDRRRYLPRLNRDPVLLETAGISIRSCRRFCAFQDKVTNENMHVLNERTMTGVTVRSYDVHDDGERLVCTELRTDHFVTLTR